MDANGIIRLLRSGIVPVQKVRALSVGYDKLDGHISKHLREFKNRNKIGPLFVQGEWGSGKSHFLAYLQAQAQQGGIGVAELSLNARTSALNHPQRMYAQIAAGLRYGDCRGLRELFVTKAGDAKFRSEIIRAIGGSNSSMHSAVLSILQHFGLNVSNQLVVSESPAWTVILGTDISWADYSYKKEEALNRLTDLAGLFRRTGIHGIAILLDELETMDQLWNIRSRLAAYSVLGRLCRNPDVLPVLAITKRFNRMIDSDIDRISTISFELSSDARWFLQGWKRGDWPEIIPPPFSSENAKSVIEKISSLYVETYDSPALPETLKRQCLAQWMTNPAKNPRQLIRLAVDALDRLRPL